MGERLKNFTQLPNRIIWSKKLKPNEKLVLWLLASYNPCFVSYTGISKTLGISRESVWKAIKKLKKIGVISVDYKGKKCYYKTLLHRVNPDENEDVDNFQSVRHTNRIGSPHELVSVRQANSNNTKVNNTKENKRARENFDGSHAASPKGKPKRSEYTLKEVLSECRKTKYQV